MDNKIALPDYYVHSQNPTGRENIKSILDNFINHQRNYGL